MLDDLAAILRDIGRSLLEWRSQGAAAGAWEGSQFKSVVDQWAHALLRERIRTLDPNIPVISEEDAAHDASSRPQRYWLIDPIDGTASFVGGYSGFVTQAALMGRNGACLAAVHAPVLGLTYLARRGRGATLDGRPMRITRDPDRRYLIDNWPEPRGSAARLYASLHFTGYVESGSIGLKICRVADGTADFTFKDVTVRDWDVAAPGLVLAEAGGCFAALDGAAFPYRGSYEKPGMVASADPDLLADFLARRESAA